MYMFHCTIKKRREQNTFSAPSGGQALSWTCILPTFVYILELNSKKMDIKVLNESTKMNALNRSSKKIQWWYRRCKILCVKYLAVEKNPFATGSMYFKLKFSMSRLLPCRSMFRFLVKGEIIMYLIFNGDFWLDVKIDWQWFKIHHLLIKSIDWEFELEH